MTIPQAVGLGIAGDELGKKIAGNEVSVGRTVGINAGLHKAGI